MYDTVIQVPDFSCKISRVFAVLASARAAKTRWSGGKIMRLAIFSVCLSLSSQHVTAQNLKEFGLVSIPIASKNLGTVNCYLSDTLNDIQKPILVFLDGSGNQPLFSFRRNEENKFIRYSNIPFDFKALALKFHIILISKPNTPLIDTVLNENADKADTIYNKYLSSYWRVESASLALDYVFKHYHVDRKKVIVFGYSEGAQVAPRLAVYNHKVTHCIAFVGGGLNQFFDGIVKYRVEALKGDITEDEAQLKIEQLYADYASIYSNPENANKFWHGHTYLRWSSFTNTPSIEFYKQLEIPIYIAQGTNDENTSILSADYIKLEFLRLHKTNLTYKVYPDCDHFFNNMNTKRNDMEKIIDEAFKWLDNN